MKETLAFLKENTPSTRYINLKLDTYAHFDPDQAVKHTHRAIYDTAKLDSVRACLAALAAAMCRVMRSESDNKEKREEGSIHQEQGDIVNRAVILANNQKGVLGSSEIDDQMYLLMGSVSAIAGYVGVLFCQIWTKKIISDREKLHTGTTSEIITPPEETEEGEEQEEKHNPIETVTQLMDMDASNMYRKIMEFYATNNLIHEFLNEAKKNLDHAETMKESAKAIEGLKAQYAEHSKDLRLHERIEKKKDTCGRILAIW